MYKKQTKLPDWFVPVVMAICLIGCADIPAYAGELPTSHLSCFTCTGQISPLGRWCDNKNGTITDLSTGLIWLKDAGWSSTFAFLDAADQANVPRNGSPSSLNDGSKEGDWRLPTLKELKTLTTGTEAVSNYSQYFFTSVKSYPYWSISPSSADTNKAWTVYLRDGSVSARSKNEVYFVWPVRR
ncbi:MAG: DUF1566 domain-containing protein [Deltaproteobacteria bacterium]|nr:DUF1566 domain-containing protein [Deltaproteobacteria bacterium]